MFVGCCVLSVACCSLCGVRCSLVAACCLLFVGDGWMLFVEGCLSVGAEFGCLLCVDEGCLSMFVAWCVWVGV